MTRNEKIERIKDHAYGMAMQAIEYARASENLNSLADWQISILFEIGETMFKSQSSLAEKYDSLIKKTNN